MIFMIGFVVSALLGAGVMLSLGVFVVLMRKFGLISMGPLVSMILVAVPALLLGQFLFRWWNKFQVPTEHLAVGFYNVSMYGGFAGLIVSWLALLWLAHWIDPATPSRLAGTLNIVVVAMLAGLCLVSLSGPSRLLQQQATKKAAYEEAYVQGDVATVRSMLEQGYRANDLIRAIEQRNIPMMELFMDPPGHTPANRFVHIVKVLETGDRALLERFLELVDSRQRALDYGLRLAVAENRRGDFDLLMSLGAGANSDESQTALMFAALNNRLEFVEPLLAASANVNQLSGNPRSFGSTALIWAVGKGHLEMAERLIEAGADVNLTVPSEDSALHYAVRADSLRLVELLLTHGAEPNYANRRAQTALHMAYGRKKPHQAIIKALIDAGADEELMDSKGRRPADLSSG